MLIKANIPESSKKFQFKYLNYPFSPFRHQREVFESIYDNNILLESPTSSGKTAAVVYPIVDQVKEGNYRALFVYPTRALLWDQWRAISEVAQRADLTVAKVDPFTPTKNLYTIFAQNRLIAMTPDIFYFTLLRNAQHYKRFFERSVESIRHIVFDEVHLYDTYMLFNLRHLLKIIKEINPEIKIHCLSATVEHVRNNLEEILNFKVIKGEGYTGKIEIKSLFMPTLQLSDELSNFLEIKGRKVLILNSAKRAQEIFEKLKDRYANVFFVVGQRFQKEEERNAHLESFDKSNDCILVSSPMVEQGVDFRASLVISEDPASLFSIIQRFGRIGRGGVSGEFIILTNTARRHNFFNQEIELSRNEFERLLEDPNGGNYYNEPLPEEVEMMEAMLWKVYCRTQFKDIFEKINNLERLKQIYQKYEKYLPDVSFREPSPSVELRTGNIVSIWDCIRRDVWKFLCPNRGDTFAMGYLPVSPEEFLRSNFIKDPKDTPRIKLIKSEVFQKGTDKSTITGTFQIKGVEFKANGVISQNLTSGGIKVVCLKGIHKNQILYFTPKTFWEEETY